MSNIQLNDRDQQMADDIFLTLTNERDVYHKVDTALIENIGRLKTRITNIIKDSNCGASILEIFNTNFNVRENIVDAMIKYYLADPLMFTAKNRQDDYIAIANADMNPPLQNNCLIGNVSMPLLEQNQLIGETIKIKYHSPKTTMHTKASPPVIKKQTLIGNVAIEEQEDEWLIAKIAELQNQQTSLYNLKVDSKSIKNKIAAFWKAIDALVEELDSRDDSPAESTDPTA